MFITKVQFNALLNRVTAEASPEHSGALYIQLTNLNGQPLLNKKVNAAKGANILSFEMPVPLSRGIYTLKIYCEDGVWMQKLVK